VQLSSVAVTLAAAGKEPQLCELEREGADSLSDRVVERGCTHPSTTRGHLTKLWV
jgi:hypothetical protein